MRVGLGYIKEKCQLRANNLIRALYRFKMLIAETSSFKIYGVFLKAIPADQKLLDEISNRKDFAALGAICFL